MSVLTLSRPAILLSDPVELENEYRAARWAHHRLLDFEDQHQAVIDEAAEACAPGILRVGRILHKLARREEWRKRARKGSWYPKPRPKLEEHLKIMLKSLREVRNNDPRWKEALGWADEQVGAPKQVRRRRAKDPSKVKRRKGESDEAWAKRFALLTTDETDEHYAKKLAKAPRRTRREEYRAQIYAQRRCYWGTWNGLADSVDQARQAVLKRRGMGLPADWRRPRWDSSASLYADQGFRIVERGKLWWIVEIRLGTDSGKSAKWVRIKAKCGNWHKIDEDATIARAQLIRRKDGQRWRYSLSLTVRGLVKKSTGEAFARTGLLAFDWGHREHGHPNASKGIRAFVWVDHNGDKGEILLPPECRDSLDKIDAIKSKLDAAYLARKESMGLTSKNRFSYRRKLCRSGVMTEEESLWLSWEMKHIRRTRRLRKRVDNLREHAYIQAIRALRSRYATFVFEKEENASIKRKQKDEEMRRRARANRDLTARYDFVTLCKRLGAKIVMVSARNTTRECPCCGQLQENTAELLIACPSCGTVRDKDYGAALTIRKRGEEALAKRSSRD